MADLFLFKMTGINIPGKEAWGLLDEVMQDLGQPLPNGNTGEQVFIGSDNTGTTRAIVRAENIDQAWKRLVAVSHFKKVWDDLTLLQQGVITLALEESSEDTERQIRLN